jgi:hypothetical protein
MVFHTGEAGIIDEFHIFPWVLPEKFAEYFSIDN